MTEQQFNNLLDRYEKGHCTPEERRRIEQWLDTRSRGTTPFVNQEEEKFLENILRRKIYSTTGLTRTHSAGRWWKVAATLLLCIVAGYGAWKLNQAGTGAGTLVHQQTTDTIKKIMLAEGTIIWLKPGSELTYPSQFDTHIREVSLQGEALFEVERDTARPFIIRSGDIVTRVLGTSFNIKHEEAHTEVFVLTGRVSVTAAHTSENVELHPQESAVYARATRKLEKITEPQHVQPEAYVKGTEYAMDFQNTTVQEVVRRIEGKFNVTVTSSEALHHCVITADFTGQSLENTLDVIAEALDATYTIHEQHVTLQGAGCP